MYIDLECFASFISLNKLRHYISSFSTLGLTDHQASSTHNTPVMVGPNSSPEDMTADWGRAIITGWV